MPIYEYRCSSCGHQQEFLQKVSDSPLTRCTACGQDTFSKMLTAAGFQLKGSGWYATDFKGKGAPAAKPGAAAEPASAPSEPAGKEASGHACGSGACPSCS
jgi:putative FmdB family regulatory protein